MGSLAKLELIWLQLEHYAIYLAANSFLESECFIYTTLEHMWSVLSSRAVCCHGVIVISFVCHCATEFYVDQTPAKFGSVRMMYSNANRKL